MLNKKNVLKYKYSHPFHLVTPSPWPFFTSISLLGLTYGSVLYLHSYLYGDWLALFCFMNLIGNLTGWWRDVIIEATFQGHHTKAVQRGLSLGFSLFLLSEVMFFFSLFWAFLHSSLSPAIEIGGVWPPVGIDVLNWDEVPLLNTVILLSSGACVTWAHAAISVPFNPKNDTLYYCKFLGNGYFKNIKGYHSYGRVQTFFGLLFCIILGILSTLFQLYEYREAPFTMSDGIYGSVFYLLTGFHGLHVIIGTIFLFIGLVRHYYYHFTQTHHLGFIFAAWYWHFVDVIRLLVFLMLYMWGS
jgi:cytochrome c oxidase subunit 3